MNLKTLRDTPPWEWPPDAGKTFHQTLTNRQATQADRILAAELAGDFVVINDELCEDLLTVVRDSSESPKLRATAAIAFGAALEHAYTAGFDEMDDLDAPPITEETFEKIQASLHALFLDESNPKELRRRVLEASVRAQEEWHKEAVATAYKSSDREWKLTAVFCMRWIDGFDKQILEALESKDQEIHVEAVHAAGNSEVKGAWRHVSDLIKRHGTPKPLLLAAVEAIGSIRPKEAKDMLLRLASSDDEEISEAATDALSMLEPDDFEDFGGWVN
jgi:uncharacterized protein (UPF0147 family)